MTSSRNSKPKGSLSGVFQRRLGSPGRPLISGVKAFSNPSLNTMKFCEDWSSMAKTPNGQYHIGEKPVSHEEWHKWVKKEIRRRDGDGCGYCGIPLSQIEVHLEHIRPASKGGGDELENLLLACEFCNMAKQDHDLEYFLSWLAHIRSGYFECRAKPIRNFLQRCDPSISDRLQKSWWEETP